MVFQDRGLGISRHFFRLFKPVQFSVLFLAIIISCILAPSTWAAQSVSGYAYSYAGNGATSAFTGAAGTYTMTYSIPATPPDAPAGYAALGVGINGNPNNMSIYSTLSFDLRGPASVVTVYIQWNDGTDHKSGPINIIGVDPTVYKTFSVALSSFSGLDLTKVKDIQFNPRIIGSSLSFDVKNINFNANTPPRTEYWVAGAMYNYSWGNGTSNATGSLTDFVLNYKKPTATDGAGIGISVAPDWSILDLSAFSVVSINLKSDAPTVKLSFLYFNNGDPLLDAYKHESATYEIGGIPAGSYKTFAIPLSSFPDVNFQRVKAIQLAPQEISATTLSMRVASINFSVLPPAPPLNTLIMDRLVSEGKIPAGYYPLLTSTSNYKLAAANVWAGYKKTFIDPYKTLIPGYAGLVFDPTTAVPLNAQDAGDKSTSEAIGYGLLLALFLDDQPVFDAILNRVYSTSVYKSATTKLFAWRFGASGILDNGHSATDGDQDVALALVFADMLKKGNSGAWGSSAVDYATKAQDLIDAIYNNDYEYYKYINLGDYVFGGRKLTNLSYFSPAWYRIFAQYENKSHDWQYLIDQGYTLLTQQTGYPLGLAPNWCDGFGTDSYIQEHPTANWANYEQGKDAIRVYMRLATDYIWYGDPRAKTFLLNTKKLLAAPYNKNPNVITELKMDGTDVYTTHNYSDISFVGMFAAGAAGLWDDAGSAAYRQTWKTVFDSYLADALNGENSFFSKSYPDGKYEYYNQSLGLFSALMISGAMPNLYKHMVSYGTPAIAPGSIPAKIYNNSLIALPYRITSPAGGGAVSTVNLQLTKGTSTFTLRMNNLSNIGTCTIVNDPENVVKAASVFRSVVNNQLFVTFNVVVSANWINELAQYTVTAIDRSGQSLTRTNLDSSSFYNYSDVYLTPTQVTINFPAITDYSADQICRLPNVLTLGSSLASSNLVAYTDNNPNTSGNRGLAMMSSTGNILATVTLNLILTDTATTPSAAAPNWKTVYDRQDFIDLAISRNTVVLAPTNKYLFLKANFSRALFGQYMTKLNLRLYNDSNKYLVSDFEDRSLMTNFSSYWSPVSVPDAGTSVALSVVPNGFNGSNSMKMVYTLGAKSLASGPQAIALFSLNPSSNPINVANKYSGISFMMKAAVSNPIGVVLESTNITDYDYFLQPIVSPANQWVRYNLYFNDFHQTGFGAVTNIATALQNVRTIQFKTLNEKQGESGTYYIDEVMFLP